MIDIKNLCINTPHFLLITISISIVIKSCLLAVLIPHQFRRTSLKYSLLLLFGVIIGSIGGDVAWLIKLARHIFFPTIPYTFTLFFLRLAWAFLVLQYLALGLFLESLTERKFVFNYLQKALVSISCALVGYYVYIAFFSDILTDEIERNVAFTTSLSTSPFLEVIIMRHTTLYIIPLLILPSLFLTIKKLRSGHLPKILNHQLSALITFLITPYLIAELLIATNFEFVALKEYTYASVGISTMLITYFVYYCIRRLMGMRFLNASEHVESKDSFNFIDDFKIVLEQLSSATTMQELHHITTTFFQNACAIPQRKTHLYMRSPEIDRELSSARQSTYDTIVENFISKHSFNVSAYLRTIKILIYDEISFSNFYQEDPIRSEILQFMQHISADIFLPIFEKDRLIAYIIVESHARPAKLYSNIERDEMLVFASYLTNIINLLQNKNLESLLLQHHELKAEMYQKHQEISHYKESIRSFLKNSRHKEIGIIFYKQRRFIFANQSAKEMISINPNTQEGHPLTRALKNIARQVEEYKSPQSLLTKDLNGTRLVISGVPNLEQQNVLLTISYPDIADILSSQISLLRDPAAWDYLLYLQTTKPGHMISQLMPASSETFLNIKIKLLQIALSYKATLLEMAADDVMPTVELMHHISNRETLHTISLSSPVSGPELGISLFGTHPLHAPTSDARPLLERLNNTGTLFIQNIEHMPLEVQEHLAEYITYGYYRPIKSDQRYPSSTRIICSTQHNILAMVHEGTFSSALYAELKKSTIAMPSLLTIAEHELYELADGFAEQIISAHDFKNLLELNEKDKARLIASRPVSLYEFKTRIQQVLIQKSKKHQLDNEVQIDTALDVSDPELIQAARLGKHALRDHKMMLVLWNKFKNQNQIATFLGVNRSSVNRRCKEYNLL